MRIGDYDLAGFVVGAVERTRVLPRLDRMHAGDLVLGLASSGVHSNGYSLVRKVVQASGLTYSSACPFSTTAHGSMSLGEALLTPTRIYVEALMPLIKAGLVKSMAHITGGGFTDNIPRALPDHLGVELDATSWPLLPVFQWLKKVGNIENKELARTFNCGIGMILVVEARDLDQIKKMVKEPIYELGHVVERNSMVTKDPVFIKNMDVAWN